MTDFISDARFHERSHVIGAEPFRLSGQSTIYTISDRVEESRSRDWVGDDETTIDDSTGLIHNWIGL